MNLAADTVREFQNRYGEQPRAFYAPGRVNLIGEHTDYNDGFVMPVAISFGTCAAIAPRPDRTVAVYSTEFKEEKRFSLEIESPKRQRRWSDYVEGVARVLADRGHTLSGANLVLHGDVPIGAGLSSSAATEVAAALAFLAVNSISLPARDIALLCQRAENEFVGTRCGIMDQFVSVHGQPQSALLLDCRSLAFELVPIPSEVALVICNSMVKHQLASGEYNSRRAECEEGVRLLRSALPSITALRDVSALELDRHKDLLPPLIYRRCRHVVTENARVLAAAQALRSGDLPAFGRLMSESHRSLRDDYQVSCSELDILVEIASTLPGILGARMTGGGFGGCTINLVAADAAENFASGLAAGYRDKTGVTPEVYISCAAAGASELTAVQQSPC